jgi:hypothetical protein
MVAALHDQAYGVAILEGLEEKEKGLKCTKSNFWMNIRNPLYCGKTVIPKYKAEEAHFVKAQRAADC